MSSVPSRDPIQRFEDILENITRIEEFTAGMNATTFVEDLKTTNAVERCLERISEAARKLGSTAEDLLPEIPWSKIRAIGNLLRHEYDRILPDQIWLVVEDDLPKLKAAAISALNHLQR